MRPRVLASAMGLLPRMEARRWNDGKTVTYRYRPVDGNPINLGTDRAAAIRKVLDMLGESKDQNTLQWVWDRFTEKDDKDKYRVKRWRDLAESSKADYRQAWRQINKTFGKMHISDIDSTMVARYVHVERADTPKRANTEKALLSNLFAHGILLGACKVNATDGVQPHKLESRTEAPDSEVLAAFLEWLGKQTPQRRIIGLAAEYASLAGNRKVEFLRLTWPQVDRVAGVVRTFRAKQRGGKRERVVEEVEISPSLAAVLDRLEAIRPDRECLYVFPTRDGNSYSDSGFKALWQRCILNSIEEKVIDKKTRFTFHDLRAFYATTHKAKTGNLPDLHKNKETTARVYDRTKTVFRKAI